MPPSTPLHVIALVSGGKDSFFSLLHCVHHGHQIVALANLSPAQTLSDEGCRGDGIEADDLNSFMYQTVGHSIVPLYAEALDLPLYRCGISGIAVNTDREYGFTETNGVDETENLIPLLEEIKQKHPQANALSTGAILSTYQRTRVESVAARLQLTSLAYLWQYPALPPPIERPDSITGLLDDMEAAGCDSRLIKIASAGVKETLLWSRVSDPVIVQRLAAGMLPFSMDSLLPFRAALVGEGGEYETLAVNGPTRLWKKRICVDSGGNRVVRDDGGALRLTFGQATLVEQQQHQGLCHEQEPFVRIPALFDDRFKQLRDVISVGVKTRNGSETAITFPPNAPTIHKCITRSKSSLVFNNVTDPGLSANISNQTAAIMLQLEDELHRANASNTVPRIIFTTILLRNMSDFPVVNTIYGKHFNHIHPPARVTVCCGNALPKGVLVSMSFSATKVDASRVSGLHVQSISYWAPANIGPYSQAISVRGSVSKRRQEEMVHVAGQIPLVPGSMQLLDGDDVEKTVLSLQHLWRIGQCVGVDWWAYGVAYLADGGTEDVQRRATVAWQAWMGAHVPSSGRQDIRQGEQGSDDEDTLDVWDIRYNNAGGSTLPAAGSSTHPTTNSHLHALPNPDVLAQTTSSSSSPSSPSSCSQSVIPPFLAAHVLSLPRSAPIEWHSLGLAHLLKRPASTPSLHITHETTAQFSISRCSWRRQLHQREAKSDPDDNNHQQHCQHADSIDHEAEDDMPDFFTVQIFPDTTTGSPTTHLHTALASPLMTQHHRRCRTNLTLYHSTSTSSSSSSSSSLEELQRCIFPIPHSTDTDTATATATAIATAPGPSSTGNISGANSDGCASCCTVIPCTTLWGTEGKRVEVAVSGQLTSVDATDELTADE